MKLKLKMMGCVTVLLGSLVAVAGAVACDKMKTASVPVGVLKSRDYLVEVFQKEGDTRFTVKNQEGAALSKLLTQTELVSNYPELKSMVEGVSSEDGTPLMMMNSTFESEPSAL